MKNQELIPLMLPDIHQEDIDAVVSVLQTGMLVQGDRVAEFEKNFAAYLGVNHAITVCNGTVSLYLALLALGVGKGDEVIVPAFSHIATANVVELIGATSVFVDIDFRTFNIDVFKIEEAITAKTKAIIPVHEFGLSCEIKALCDIANKYNLYVIEDAACAFGAQENDKFVGTFGIVGSFSFHPRKAITSGEGGMLVTNNNELANKFKILRNHGIEIQNEKMEFVDAGFNFRMTDIQGTLLNSQFARMNSKLKYKNQLAKLYFKQLEDIKSFFLPFVPENKNHTWQSFHIVLNDNIDREKLILSLKAHRICTNYGAQCIPYQKYFQVKYNLDCESLFPNALRSFKKGLVLPLYEKLTNKDILFISDNLKKLI